MGMPCCCVTPCPASFRDPGFLTNNQLLTFPSGSWMNAWFSSWRHSPSTMNLYWWYPGGRLHTTAKTWAPPGVGSGAIGTVSSQFVNEPHRCTCESGGVSGWGECQNRSWEPGGPRDD